MDDSDLKLLKLIGELADLHSIECYLVGGYVRDLFLDEKKKSKDLDFVVVEHKDRLTRMGFNYFKTFTEVLNKEIEVINNINSDEEDLVQDFVSIITSFCSRIYGKRRSKRLTEKLIKDLSQSNQ